MVLPNFLIIGAAKSGTTTLYECLRTHPQIYMSALKEPKFFSYDPQRYAKVSRERVIHDFPITNLEDYQALFATVTHEIAVGEASPTYLQSSIAPERIRSLIPDVKLIAILREPASRAYSQYVMWYRYNCLPHQLRSQDVLDNFVKDFQKGNGGTRIRYCDCLKPYLKLFHRDQIKIYLFDDLKTDQGALLIDICQFLQVDESLLPSNREKVFNKGGIPKNQLLFNYLEKSKRIFKKNLNPFFPESSSQKLRAFYAQARNLNLVDVPPLSQEIRQQLRDIYRQDTLKLQDLLQRDLSQWLED